MSPSKNSSLFSARKPRTSALASFLGLLAGTGATDAARDLPRAPRADLDRHFSGRSSSMTVLVPGDARSPEAVRTSLWAAALQEYPSVRVVLLVDDEGSVDGLGAEQESSDIRLHTQQIGELLSEPRARFAEAFMDFQLRTSSSTELTVDEVYQLAWQFGWASGWVSELADLETIRDDVDEYFVTRVLRALAVDLDRVRASLTSAADSGLSPTEDRMLELYRRLMWTFDADLVTFDRDQYASLAEQSNKATTLATFADNVGLASDDDRAPVGTVLSAVRRRHSSYSVYPDATYIVELEEPSVLIPEYALRLVHELEQPGNERVAATQTSYSTSRVASTLGGMADQLDARRRSIDSEHRLVA